MCVSGVGCVGADRVVRVERLIGEVTRGETCEVVRSVAWGECLAVERLWGERREGAWLDASVLLRKSSDLLGNRLAGGLSGDRPFERNAVAGDEAFWGALTVESEPEYVILIAVTVNQRRIKMRRTKLVAIVAGLGMLLLASSAFAAKTTEGGKDGYGYEFEDDPLAAGGLGPNDAAIRVRPGIVRSTLIRPRISFVDNMLKSVENL